MGRWLNGWGRPGLWAALWMAAAIALFPGPVAAADCDEGTLPSGGLYRICVPEEWNQTLVIYAHGYVAANQSLQLPEDNLGLPGGGSVSGLLTDLGYAYATTSYRSNGLAVAFALEDLLELSAAFSARHGSPARRVMVGASEGGLVTVLAAERYPNLFDGALALCGPYGDFDDQVNYVGDFRVLFDYFFADLLPPTPVEIPPALLDTWETSTYSTTVQPVVFDPANAAALEQLLATAGAAYDPLEPATREVTVERLLWYNIYATNDARVRLGGQPYDNSARSYAGALDDDALNRDVQRFSASPAALAAMDAAYQTRGGLQIPLITVHTSGDPVVPAWHSARYRAKVEAAGASRWHEAYVLNRFGHCNFTALELITFFNRMVEQASERVRAVYLPSVAAATELSPAAVTARAE